MRIGIDARAATESPGGRGRVVREVLRALARRDDRHRFALYARSPWEGAELDERFEWRLVAGREPGWQLRAARRAGRECDVFLAANTYAMAGLLAIPAVPVVHDVLPYRRALGRPLANWLAEAGALAAVAPRAAGFITVSQATADALTRRHPATRGRITVAHLGVSPSLGEPTEPPIAPAGFVLALGWGRRKNLAGVAEAHALLPARLRMAHPLVVVGPARDAGSRPDGSLTELGRVSDGELGALYRACGAFCLPSLAEGFGLPVAEAMAAGAPIVISRRGSLPEVAGDAAVYVDPESPASIARGLARVLDDPAVRERMARRGRERAATLTWERTAGRILGALEGAAAGQSM